MHTDLKKINLHEGMIDSHFHFFHMKKREMDYKEIIEACFASGLEYAIDIGINPDNFKQRIDAASQYPGLYTAHGFYPSECTAEGLDSKLDYLEHCLKTDPKAVALGEIGFDFFHDYGDIRAQEDLLRRQLDTATRLDLPVIIHSRDAEEDTLRVLSDAAPPRGGIIHCYSYSIETARKFIDMGFYISFAGNVTYKNTEQIQQAAMEIPLDRLLLETDAPYLSPQKVRGRKNHPGYIGYTYEAVASLRNIPLTELIHAVNGNLRRLFTI